MRIVYRVLCAAATASNLLAQSAVEPRIAGGGPTAALAWQRLAASRTPLSPR